MKLSEFFSKIRKSIPMLVEAAEAALKDKKITPEERKPLVKTWIQILADSFGVKLSWWQWLILSWLIDWAARKLPSKDIILPPIVSVKF